MSISVPGMLEVIATAGVSQRVFWQDVPQKKCFFFLPPIRAEAQGHATARNKHRTTCQQETSHIFIVAWIPGLIQDCAHILFLMFLYILMEIFIDNC